MAPPPDEPTLDATPMIPRRLVLASPLLMTACASPPSTTPTPEPLREGQHPRRFAGPGLLEPVQAWLHLPRGYLASTHAWPLVIFLHGSGERGTELDRVKVHGPPRHAAAGRDYPFVLVSPQLPEGRQWSAVELHALLAQLRSELRIDAARVTATGLSLGGFGVWEWASAFPQDLAGIAPVCGFGRPGDVCRMKEVPVRAYHGDADDIVPLAGQQACIDALRACGGTADFTIYRGVGHDSWTPAYEDPALVPWLMARRRS
jgi:predicted peptidase